MKTLLARLTAGAFLASLLIAPAQPTAQAGLTALTGAFTYQGRLRVGGTNANGVYDFRFTLWNAAAAGAQIGAISPSENVTVTAGLFTTTVNFGAPPFVGDQRWLQIEVRVDGGGVFTTLTPRQELRATPYSLFALGIADGALPPSYAVAVDFKNAANEFTGRLVDVRNASGVATIGLTGGGVGAAGDLELFNAAGSTTQILLNGDFGGFGGEMALMEEDGSTHTFMEPDVNGTGGFLLVADGFIVNGNAGGGNPVVDISGSASSSTFNTTVAGNASVVLPTSAVDAAEMFDEPGVANNHTEPVVLGAALSSVLSRTITCPTAGFVLVLAHADLSLNHDNGTGSTVNCGVSTVAGSLPVHQDLHTVIPPVIADGLWDFPVSSHGLFAVAAGANTFHFNASRTGGAGGGATFFDIQLTCVFFPTAYGTTVSNDPEGGVAAADGSLNNPALARSPLTEAEIAQEKHDAADFDAARLQREMLAMQAQMAAMQKRLDQVLAEQGHPRR